MTVYREQVVYGDRTVLLDEYGDPPPGDPNGPWQKRSTQLARGHKMQELWGWEYTTTSGEPPAGEGWEINGYVGKNGFGQVHGRGGSVDVTYWRRRKP